MLAYFIVLRHMFVQNNPQKTTLTKNRTLHIKSIGGFAYTDLIENTLFSEMISI